MNQQNNTLKWHAEPSGWQKGWTTQFDSVVSVYFHFSSQKNKHFEVLCQHTCFVWRSEKEKNSRLAWRGYLITLFLFANRMLWSCTPENKHVATKAAPLTIIDVKVVQCGISFPKIKILPSQPSPANSHSISYNLKSTLFYCSLLCLMKNFSWARK